MISVTVSTAFFIYLSMSVSVIVILWLWNEWSLRRKTSRAELKKWVHCEVCFSSFIIRQKKDSLRCPVCGTFMETGGFPEKDRISLDQPLKTSQNNPSKKRGKYHVI